MTKNKLPKYFNADNSDPIVFALPKYEEFKKPEFKDGVLEFVNKLYPSGMLDRNAYLDGDMPENTKISCQHGSIYITGRMEGNATISARHLSIMSAAGVDESVVLSGGCLMILGNEYFDKEAVKKVSSGENTKFGITPVIIIVPEGKRADIFDFIVKKTSVTAESELDGIPTAILRKIQGRFFNAEMKFFNKGKEVKLPVEPFTYTLLDNEPLSVKEQHPKPPGLVDKFWR